MARRYPKRRFWQIVWDTSFVCLVTLIGVAGSARGAAADDHDAAINAKCSLLLTKLDGSRFHIFKEPWILGKPFAHLTPKPQETAAAWRSRCLEETTVWYGSNIQDKDRNAPVRFNKLVDQLRAKRPVSEFLVIDVESWPTQGSQPAVNEAKIKYTNLLEMVRKLAPTKKIGFYNLPPVPDYWRIKAGEGSPKYKAWQKDNDRFYELAGAVDAFFPSLYTGFEENIVEWRTVADPKLAEVARISGGKPVVPFIMPYYHEGNKIKGGTEIDQYFFQDQLAYLFEHTDGAIVWTGLSTWDDQSEWWKALDQFLAERQAAVDAASHAN